MLRLYARALKGKRARGERPQKRGHNISIIGAISWEKVLAKANIYGAVDGVTFEAFILKEVVPLLWKGACVIMDNAKIPKKQKWWEKLLKKWELVSYFYRKINN